MTSMLIKLGLALFFAVPEINQEKDGGHLGGTSSLYTLRDDATCINKKLVSVKILN